MLSYTYDARNIKTGEKITNAEVEADSEAAAARLLTERGLAPIQIRLKGAGNNDWLPFSKHIPAKQVVIFSRQLSTLVNSGLPLVQSLTAVSRQTTNKKLKLVVDRVISDIEAGMSLANAMSRHPNAFGDVYTALIAAGEASGTLDVSLERLATQQEKDAEIVSKIRGAMIYPVLVIVVLMGVVAFLMTSVLPQVETLYKGLPGVKLPPITSFLINFSHVLIKYWWVVILVVGVGIYLFIRWIGTKRGRLFFDNFKLHAWPVAPLFQKLYMARFARVSATLVASGVPLLKVLQTTSKSIGNVHIEASITRAAESVKGGKALSESLAGDPNFLELVPNMIRTGEQSGALDNMLGKLADYYEKEVDSQIKSISTIIEPVLMIVVGIVALIIVAAVLLPIYSLAGKNLTGN